MAGKKPLHEGHRQRMRQRVEQQGFENLAPHEALEVLLYTTIPRGDTNALAHALLERFGSFAGVLEAGEEELLEVEGVGPATARMLHLLPEIFRRYTRSRTQDSPVLRTTEDAVAFLQARYVGLQKERALLVSLDRRGRVHGLHWLREGAEDRVSLELKDVVSAALKSGQERVLLCHNHPNGVALPSREDLQATENIVRALGMVQVSLRDHIILTETEDFSMREANRLPFYDFETGQVLRPY